MADGSLVTRVRDTLDEDPQFCVTCGEYLDPDPTPPQTWFWHGDHSSPEHFDCQWWRLARGKDDR